YPLQQRPRRHDARGISAAFSPEANHPAGDGRYGRQPVFPLDTASV
ncbi:hypothetical protein BN1723_020609, partial [Verticillium longisporum]